MEVSMPSELTGVMDGYLAEFEKRIFSYITRVRDQRFVIVDEAKGLVCGTFLMDVPGRREDFASFPIPFEKLPVHMYTPHTIMLAELFKIVSGQIREIEALMVNVPLGATSGWSNTHTEKHRA
jgi:hypothetical protein